jgi:hypothetical protein
VQELNKDQEEYIAKLEILRGDYCEVFSGDRGKHILEDLERKCYAHRTTFSVEATEMAFREGQRSILLHILNMQQIDTERTKQMLKQQKAESE